MKNFGKKDSKLTTNIDTTVQKKLLERPPLVHGLILKATDTMKSFVSDLISEVELREIEKKLQHVINHLDDFVARYPEYIDIIHKVSFYSDTSYILDKQNGVYTIREEEISSEFIQDVISF